METPSRWRQLRDELQRRKVWRVAVVYATTAFVVVQVADLTFERLTLPPWTVTLVVALALVGFPIAVVLAWAFEVTPDGVRRTETSSATAFRPLRTEVIFASAAGVALLGAAGWWLQGTDGRSGVAVERLAVLPLANLMNDPGQAYFVQGMHDGLISELQQAGVSVIARTSVMRYADRTTPAREIARELDVDALVEGTVFRAGDSVEIEAGLVDPATEEYLWRASFGGHLGEVVSLHRELTRAIADEIQAALSPEAEARLAEDAPVDPEAYDAYLKGVHHSQRFTPEDLTTALEYFERAVELDSTFAPAHAGVARVWGFRSQAGIVSAGEARRRAQPAMERARELGGGLAGNPIVATGAGTSAWWDWNFEEAEAAYRRAIEMNPKHPEARVFYGHLLAILGRWSYGRKQVETGRELDPLNPFIQGLYGTFLYFVREHEEAIAVLEEMLRRHPGAGFGRSALSGAYDATGQYGEAMRVLQDAAESRGRPEVAAALRRGYREGGYRTAMHRAADSMAAAARTEHRPPFRTAIFYLRAGEMEKALEWLERSYEQRDQNMPYIGVIPDFEPLHDHPRFRALAERVGVPIVTGPVDP